MRILVTGSAGFIGSHLSFRLKNQGHEILGVDCLTDYYSVDLKKLRIRNLLLASEIKSVEIDITDEYLVEEIFNQFQPEVVVHLAAQAGVRLPIEKYHLYFNNNIIGFSNIVKNVLKFKVKKFLYASSSSVYGNSSNQPFSEEDFKLNPQSVYGATKLANEILAKSLHNKTSSKIRGLRFFTVYGPYGRPDMSYLRIFNSALNNSEFVMYGDGKIQRDFTYIEDVTTSIEKLILQLDRMPEGCSDVTNIGGGNPVTMLQLIKTIEEVTNKKVKIRHIEQSKDDMLRTEANYSYLSKLIEFRPKTQIRDGIEETFQWIESFGDLAALNNWTKNSI